MKETRRNNRRTLPKHSDRYLDKALGKTREWLKEIEHDLYLDSQHEAYAALRAVLHCLRDRLSTDEAAHFGAQLPMLVRGIYYEGWDPHPKQNHDPQEFFNEVKRHLKEGLNPIYITEGILRFLESKIGPAAVNAVKSALPAEIAALWPSLSVR